MPLRAGVARTCITPFWGVELTGWGYYLERRWQRVHDHLNATAIVIDNGTTTIAIVSLDLMIISSEFTRHVRERIECETRIPGSHVLVACTHTHNAPASGGLRGVGEVDPAYEDLAARQAATAAILAYRQCEPVTLHTSDCDVADLTFNRTRENGPIDPRLTTLRIDRMDGSPLAFVVNFQGHPTVHTVLRPYDVTRDVPGEVCDHIESALPGVTAMYLQGACGDVNFRREFSTPERCHEPARKVAQGALECQSRSRQVDGRTLAAAVRTASLPTRRWTRDEILHDRDEAARRMESDDIRGWRETIGRAMTNRPDDMVARHGGDERKAVRAMCRFNLEWTEETLKDWESRPEFLDTEVQALRIGDLGIVSNSSEFFSSFALDIRERCELEHLMVSCYSNGRIGYVPDAHDIAAKSYAGWQSPKYCNQFPFVDESGPALSDAMLSCLADCGPKV